MRLLEFELIVGAIISMKGGIFPVIGTDYGSLLEFKKFDKMNRQFNLLELKVGIRNGCALI